MSYARPEDLDELVRTRAEHPDWLVVAGGTDVMVPINFGRSRPSGVIDVTRVAGLGDIAVREDGVRLGAGVTFARLEWAAPRPVPGLAIAARGVGSAQIRAVATLGGNLATGSPAGDAHPVLVAAGARIELRSVRGTRNVPVTEFFLGPGRTVLESDEVITSVHVPVSPDSSQQFSKIGGRNAMVIAVASLGMVIDWTARRVGVGLGSVGPVPLRAEAAEEFVSEALWAAGPSGARFRQRDVEEFARLAADAAQPIDDVRGTAEYRRHTVRLMARRCLTWVLTERGRRIAA